MFNMPDVFWVMVLWPIAVAALLYIVWYERKKHRAICERIYAEYGAEKSPCWVLEVLNK